jgi:carbamoyltransferase
MLLVADVAKSERKEMTEREQGLFGIEKLNTLRSTIPSVTHVDYSARIQTVHEQTNPLYYKLLKRFKDLTGCPILVNTSFNVRGEPIICSPADAFRCFMGTGLDLLVVGNAILTKESQSLEFSQEYASSYALD